MESLKDSEKKIGILLRAGVIVSALITAFGWVLQLTRGSGNTGLHEVPHSLIDLISGLVHALPSAWISLGIILLIALPILRVALTLVLFTQRKDRLFMALSFYVLVLLCAGAFLGRAL